MSALEEVLATTYEEWVSENPIDIHYPANRTLAKMWKSKKYYDGGTFIGVPVVVGGGTSLIKTNAVPGAGTTFTAPQLAAIAAAKTDVVRKISLPWKKAFAEADVESNALTRNSGAAQVIDIAKARLNFGRTQIFQDLATFAFNDIGASDDWHGLPLIISNAAYGQDEAGVAINPLTNATFTDWRAKHVIASSLQLDGVTYTVAAPSVFTSAAHGLVTGDQVELTTAADADKNTLNSEIAVNSRLSRVYWVRRIDANTFSLATTRAIAVAGPANVAATANTISGSLTVHKAASLSNLLLEELWSEMTDTEEDSKPDSILLSKRQYILAKNRLGLQYFNRDGDKNINLSFDSLNFMSAEVMEERRMADHELYFATTKDLHLGCTTDKMRQGQFDKFEHMGKMTREDVFRAQAWLDANFICTNRRNQGKITNILPS